MRKKMENSALHFYVTKFVVKYKVTLTTLCTHYERNLNSTYYLVTRVVNSTISFIPIF